MNDDLRAAQAASRALVGCRGKKAFETFTGASRVAARANRHGGGAKAYQPYHCKVCSHFHVGNAGAGSTVGRHRRAFQRKRREAQEAFDERAER